MEYRVVERFISLDGEGSSAGELAAFIRFYGCNLKCTWCDTKYSFDKNEQTELLSADAIISYITQGKVLNVTVTGGEPLLVENIEYLLDCLDTCNSFKIHIETNGSVNIKSIKKRNYKNISFVIDYKLPHSGMESHMCCDNLMLAGKRDVYKFVIAGHKDLERAFEIINDYSLTEKCSVHLSPVLGRINPHEIADFMKEKSLTGVKLQLQLHKFIWPETARGV